MSVTFSTAYPAALTNAAWQKKKSFLDKAKSKTKTGLGAELLKAEAAWKNIKFDLLDASKVAITTADTADHAKQAATTHLHTLGAAFTNAAGAAAVKAAATKTNAGLSGTAKAAAATLEKGLLAQSALIRDIKLDDFDQRKALVLQLTAQTNLAAVKRNLVKADTFIDTVEKTPTRLAFNKGIQDACRYLTVPLGTIGTSINGKPDPKPLIKNLEKWADGKDQLPAYPNTVEEKKKVLAAIKTYKDAIAAVKSWAA